MIPVIVVITVTNRTNIIRIIRLDRSCNASRHSLTPNCPRLQLKKDYLDGLGDTLDVVVVGAYRGRGKRAGVFGGFLLACYEPEHEQYQSLCKIGTGFSDEDLQNLTKQLQEHVIDAPRPYYR